MKKALATFALVALAAVAQAQVISQWTFESAPPADLNNNTQGPSVAADVGNGTATGVHANANTDWSTPTGNQSANSFSAQTWTANDYWQFSLSTVGFTDIFVTVGQTRSSTGPASWEFQYSSNGGTNFSTLTAYTVPEDSWSTGSFDSTSEFTFDLTGVTALDNNANVVFRLVNLSSPAAGGTSRVDDFYVSAGEPVYPAGFVIPEPATYMLFGIGILIAAHRLRRKQG